MNTRSGSLRFIGTTLSGGITIVRVSVHREPSGALIVGRSVTMAGDSKIPITSTFGLLRNNAYLVGLSVGRAQALGTLRSLLIRCGLLSETFLANVDRPSVGTIGSSTYYSVRCCLGCRPSHFGVFNRSCRGGLLRVLSRANTIKVGYGFAKTDNALSGLLRRGNCGLSI